MSILQLRKLTVRFGGLTAVQQLDCAIEAGQIHSIIGPNGAGKTTVFNVITGIYAPSSGTIEFRGSRVLRPFTWRVLASCISIGLATGIVAALLSLDVNALWRATIKRNFSGPGHPFSYSDAGRDAIGYLRGTLALDAMRGGRWAVNTADGRRTLGYAASREQAEQMREHFAAAIAAAHRADPLQQRDGHWLLLDAEGAELATYESRADAAAVIEKYRAIYEEPIARRSLALITLLAGLVVGTAGGLTIWNRARATPEVISRAGIARTFQNIRLFANMTALDNVLVGMDRTLRGGVLRMALRLPGARGQELAARAEAERWLALVGLQDKHAMLAKNLPYGDQRRLEIARALATEPQLILLDEPAAGMNPAESLELNGLIEQIRGRGITVMLIEHHMKVVMSISDRIVVLDYGEKIAEGTPDQVRCDPRVIAAYLGSEEVT